MLSLGRESGLANETAEAPLGHLDARAGLAWQLGFSVAAFGARGTAWFVALAALALGTLAMARVSLRAVLREYWVLVAILATGPIGAGIVLIPIGSGGETAVVRGAIHLGPVGFDPAAAEASLRSVFRVVLVLLVAAGVLRTTPVRETRAAVQWAIPGRPGRLFGAGMAVAIRFVPLVLGDLRRRRQAAAARLGEERGAVERARRLARGGLADALGRADRLALALRARCFSWNPTPPRLEMGALDYLVVVASAAMAVGAVGPGIARWSARVVGVLLGTG